MKLLRKIHNFFFPKIEEINNRPIYAKEYLKLVLLTWVRTIGMFLYTYIGIMLIIFGILYVIYGDNFNEKDNSALEILSFIPYIYFLVYIGHSFRWGYYVVKNRFLALGLKDYNFILGWLLMLGLFPFIHSYLLFHLAARKKWDLQLLGIYVIGIPIFFDKAIKRNAENYKNSLKASFYQEILTLKHKGANYDEEEIKEKYQKSLEEYIEKERLTFLQNRKGNIPLNKNVVHMDLEHFYKEENEIFNLCINYPEITKIDF